MIKQITKSKVLIALVLLLAVTVAYSPVAFARDGHDRDGGYDRGGGRNWGGNHGHYYYHGGRWYDGGWFWGSFFTGLAIGTFVAALPPYYETVYVRGTPYYCYDNVYYRPWSSGYVVVPTPSQTVVVAQPPVTYGTTIVINVPNAAGGYTPVRLTRRGTGYIGPQGEYYEGNPTVDQLRVLYGR